MSNSRGKSLQTIDFSKYKLDPLSLYHWVAIFWFLSPEKLKFKRNGSCIMLKAFSSLLVYRYIHFCAVGAFVCIDMIIFYATREYAVFRPYLYLPYFFFIQDDPFYPYTIHSTRHFIEIIMTAKHKKKHGLFFPHFFVYYYLVIDFFQRCFAFRRNAVGRYRDECAMYLRHEKRG